MPILRILLLVLAATLASAQAPDPSAPPSPPAAADIAQRAAALEALRPRYLNDKGEPTDAAALARLDDAIARLRAIPDLSEEARALAADAESAPAQIASLQAELDAPAPSPEALIPEAGAELSTLESAQRTIEDRLQTVRARLESIGRQRVERAARAEAIPGEIAATLLRLDEADDQVSELGTSTSSSPAPTDAAAIQRLVFMADREHALAMVQKLEAERRRLAAAEPRMNLRIRLAEREASMLGRAREVLASRVAEARRRDAARQEAETRRAAADVPPELEPLRSEALRLGQENTRQVARLIAVEADLAATQALAQQVGERDAQVRARVAKTQGGAQIGQLLQRVKESLPSEAALQADAARLNREAGALDDRAFELEMLLDELPGTASEIRRALRDSLDIDQPTEPQLAAAQSVIELQRQSARELLHTIAGPGRLIAQVQELAAHKSDLAIRMDALGDFVNARILWVRSDPSIARISLRSVVNGLKWLVDGAQWRRLWSAALERPVILSMEIISVPVAATLAFVVRILLARRLHAVNDRVQMPSTDRLGLTFVAVGLAALRSATAPLVMLLAALPFALLADLNQPLARWLSSGIERAAIAVFVGSFLILLCRPGGVGQAHFRWPKTSTASVARHLRWFTPAIATLTFFIAGARATGDADPEALLRILGPIAIVMITSFFSIILHPGGPLMRTFLSDALWSGWRLLWPMLYLAIIGSFIALLTLHLLGWTFSVSVLTRRLFDTAVVIAGLILVRAIALRALTLARRRLAFEQHRKLLESLVGEQEGAATAPTGPADQDAPIAPPPPPEIDLGSIQRQTRQLLGLAMWVVGALAILPIWQEVLPAVARIDDVRLFPFTVADGASAPELRASGGYVLSLGDVITAAMVAFIGAVAIRNVPSLFEGFVLSRTRLDAGARYAAKTITRYILIATVALLFLSAVGFTGKNLGWAIAGLSVGLGLGLQELVGNLVAGLSLLFERTIRPGDWVTVGDVEGIVKSISIRATILTDFDRRDVVIPNRNLISEIVVNYTRSDATGRAIIRVGVAYGSDTRLVERLLSEAVKSHPVVDDALVTFDSFGDNSLNFTIRTLVKDICQRLTIVNELHHRIAIAFRAHNIEISFPQRDLHIRDGSLDVRIVDARPAGDPTKPA